MCGRFYVEREDLPEALLARMQEALLEKVQWGEVFPSKNVLALAPSRSGQARRVENVAEKKRHQDDAHTLTVQVLVNGKSPDLDGGKGCEFDLLTEPQLELLRVVELDRVVGEGEVADRTFELLMKDHVGEAQSGFVQGQCLCAQKIV